MSRTDKTDPIWVKAPAWRPDHRCRITGRRRSCDLPPEPPHGDPWRVGTSCRWLPDLPGYYTTRGHVIYGNPRAVRELTRLAERGIRAWWRNTRDRLLVSSYDALDDIDIPDSRYRRTVLRDWW